MTAAAPAVMLVAGEASGDLHGAGLCRALAPSPTTGCTSSRTAATHGGSVVC